MSEDEREDFFHFLQDLVNEMGIDPEEDTDEFFELSSTCVSSYIVRYGGDFTEEELDYFSIIYLCDMMYEIEEDYFAAGEDVIRQEPFADDIQELATDISRHSVRQQVIVAYLLSYELAKSLMSGILPEVLDEDKRTEEGTNFFVNQFTSYEDRHKLLNHFDVISDDVQSTLDDIGRYRGAFAHDIESRFTLDVIDDIQEELIECMAAINRLYELKHGFTPFNVEIESET